MCSEIDDSAARIVNKGVDVAVIAGHDTVDEAMKASRVLAVRGISTAVIEIKATGTIGEEILGYIEKTGAVVFTEKSLYGEITGLLMKHGLMIFEYVKNPISQNIIDAALKVVKCKLCK